MKYLNIFKLIYQFIKLNLINFYQLRSTKILSYLHQISLKSDLIKNKIKFENEFRFIFKKGCKIASTPVIYLISKFLKKDKIKSFKKINFIRFFFEKKKGTKEYFEIKFHDNSLIKIPTQNMLSEIWLFISESCFFYTSAIQETRDNKFKFIEFLERFDVVPLKQIFDEEIEENIYVYDNYFNYDKKGKKLRSNIVSFSKENNCPYFFLHVLNNYALILTTYGDPYLDLIRNKKDQQSLMNVDLGYFISTEQQLNIFIEALESNFKSRNGVEFLNLNSIQYKLIKELIDKLKEKKF